MIKKCEKEKIQAGMYGNTYILNTFCKYKSVILKSHTSFKCYILLNECDEINVFPYRNKEVSLLIITF